MWRYRSTANEVQAKYAALDRVQAVIEFDLDGRILAANANFLAAMGYSLAEIIGKHHSMFVEPAERDHANYQKFWADLRKGDFNAAQFKRLGKGGKEVWIEASYNPLLDGNGKPYKVVKFATDITAQKLVEADRAGQLAAIRKSQAVIEFSLDGTILDANENFLAVTGYTLNEVVGQHHRMFVDPAERQMPAYTAFWSKLRAGEYQAAQYRRIGKGGKEVWIEASYNPIFDPSGRPYKIVKFATDITRQVRLLDNLRVMIDKNFTEIDTAVTKSTAEAQQAAHIAGSTAENVQAMAAASEELAASVAEIASSMSSSRGATDTAFDQVNVATTFTSKLTDAASAMGGIVGLINNIAGQINLLALNATIESARAGEAGRGFAVVAQEVKSLANQAAKATEQISQEIDGVQAISGDVVQALQMILSSVELVRNNVTATAAAVEEQSAVTRDLSANMQGTAAAVTTISNNVVGITAAVTQVNNAMSNTRQAASVLVR